MSGLFASMRKHSYLGSGSAVLLVLPMLLAWFGALAADGELAEPSPVSVRGETVSVEVSGMPLGEVLEEFGQKSGIEFSIPDSVGSEPVSDNFRDLSLENGIRRLLKDHNYLVEYGRSGLGGTSQGLPRAVKVRVLGKSMVRTGAEIAAGRGGGRSSDDRIRELKRLADQEDGAQLSGALADAAHDSDDKVREAALEVMEDMGKDAPANLLMEMALADTNPALRKQALQLLSEINGEAALEPLNQARTDNDAEVRNLATELLDAINNSSGGPSE
jgi:hypothetical protein